MSLPLSAPLLLALAAPQGGSLDEAPATAPPPVHAVVAANETKLVPPPAIGASSAGRQLAIDGDTAVLWMYNPGANSWLVFERDVSGWAYKSLILTNGWEVDLAGDWIVIGDDDSFGGGQAFLYGRGDPVWTLTPGLENPLPTNNCDPHTFGYRVDMDGDRVAVVEKNRNCPWNGPSVWIAEYRNGQWRYRSRVALSMHPIWTINMDALLDGDELVVTSSYDAQYYRYDPVGDEFVHVSTILSSPYTSQINAAAYDDGVLLLSRLNPERVQIYERFDDEFRLVKNIPTTLLYTNPISVAIDDGMAAIGDPRGDLAGSNAGVVDLWSRNGGWSHVATVTASDAMPDDQFGCAVDVEHPAAPGIARLLVGARGSDTVQPDWGAGYVFDIDAEAHVYCTSKVNSENCVPRVAFSGTPSVSDGSPFTISCDNVINERVGVFFYGTNGRLSAPFQDAVRCVASPTRRIAGLFSGGNQGATDCSGEFSLDFNARIQSGVDSGLVIGAVVDGQFWYRDGASSFGTGLSEAIELTVRQ